MDFDDDEIGNFGLPLHNNNPSNFIANKKQNDRRKCGQEECSDNSSSDDDEMALSELLFKPRTKATDNASSSRQKILLARAPRAIVTPAPPPSQPQHQQSRLANTKKRAAVAAYYDHSIDDKNTINNNLVAGEDYRIKKISKKKQHTSLLYVSPFPTQQDEEKKQQKQQQLQKKEFGRKRSFNPATSFSSLQEHKNEEGEKQKSNGKLHLLDNSNDHETIAAIDTKKNNSNDDNDNNDDGDEDDAKDLHHHYQSIDGNGSNNKITPGNVKKNDANHQKSQRFRIHSLIMGHNLPIMYPDEEYYRVFAPTPAVATFAGATDQGSGGERGEKKQPSRDGSQNVIKHNNNNILTHLLQRSYVPRCFTTPPLSSDSLLTRYFHSSDIDHHHRCNENVQLMSSSSNNGSSNNSDICAMSFDAIGILLAMGDSHGKINIYDFDEVYAADLKKRNEWRRHCHANQVDAAAAALESKDRDCNRGRDEEEDCNSTTSNVDNIEEKLEEGDINTNTNDKSITRLPPATVNPVHSFKCQFIHGNDENRNNHYLNNTSNNNRPRISGINWNPDNQDHLAVSFENKSEIHLYDVASSTAPPPCLRLGESSSSSSLRGHGLGSHQQHEGVLSMRFISSATEGEYEISSVSSLSPSHNGSTQIITGGAYGTVRLWSIPSMKQTGKRHRRCCISELNAKCVWSFPVFGPKGEGVVDMLILPVMPPHWSKAIHTTTTTNTNSTKPLVLLSGGSSSTIILLDTNKCTRKAFSTSITPTVAASWNLHQLASRELAKIDNKGQLPDRRWISASNMRLIEYQRLTNEGSWWCKIGIVTKCGWVFVAELARSNNIPRLSIHIVHHTPRIQCFNSSNERLTILGGMALQYSLPNTQVPASDCIRMRSKNMIWLGDVRGKKYTLPSRDKYVLCEDYSTLEVVEEEGYFTPGRIAPSSESGIILVHLDESNQSQCNIVTRIPLSINSEAPLTLAAHPNGDWMVIGFGGGPKLISMLT